MYGDVDELVEIYDLFVGGIKTFSSDYSIQFERLKPAVVSDELVTDFIYTYFERAKILWKHGWITEEQMDIVYQIIDQLEKMNLDKSLWNNQAVKSSDEWQKCRNMGKKLLNSLGFSLLEYKTEARK